MILATVSLVLALSAPASAEGVVRILHLTDDLDAGLGPLELEDLLNDGQRAYIVVRRPYLVDADGIKDYLDKYEPRLVVSRRPLPSTLPMVTPSASLRDTARAVLERTGGALLAGTVSPAQRVQTRRLRARAHIELDDFEAAHANIMSARVLAPDDVDTLLLRQQLEIVGSAGMTRWIALHAAVRRAAVADISDGRRADALRDVAEIRLLLGDYAGAEQDLQRARRLKPGDAEIAYDLAVALRERPQDALPYADEAARLAAYPRRRAAAHRLAAEMRLDLDDVSGARASAGRALELAGDDLDALRAMTRVERDRPRRASAFARRAVAAAAKQPLWCRAAAYRFSARIWHVLKDYANAVASLRRALEVNPEDLDALEMLIQFRHERPAGAPAAGKLPSSPVPSLEGDRTEGELEGALRSAPDDLDALQRLSALRRRQNRHADATALAERFMIAVKTAPLWQQGDAYRLSARMWADLGQPIRALLMVARTEDLDRRSLETALLLAWIGQTRRELTDGAPEMTVTDAYLAIANARVTLEDADGAEAAFRKALESAPAHSRTPSTLAQFLLERGRPSEALPYVERLLKASEGGTPAERASAHRLKALVLRGLSAAPAAAAAPSP